MSSKTPVKKQSRIVSLDDPLSIAAQEAAEAQAEAEAKAAAEQRAAAKTTPFDSNPFDLDHAKAAPAVTILVPPAQEAKAEFNPPSPMPSHQAPSPPTQTVESTAPPAASSTPVAPAVAATPAPVVEADWRTLITDTERGTLNGEKLMMKLLYSTYFNLLTGTATPGQFCMTTYQIYFEPNEGAAVDPGFSFDSAAVPLGCIERIEKYGNKRSSAEYCLDIYTKDQRVLRFGFLPGQHYRRKAYECLVPFTFPPKIEFIFAFFHRGNINIPDQCNGWNMYDPMKEIERLGLPNAVYRLSGVNTRFGICDSYPRILAVPQSTTDAEITKIATFRSRGRLPVLTWKHPESNAAIFRCSQPRVGFVGARCAEDELMVSAIGAANNRNLYIFDARPKLNAVGNQLAGKGYESMDYYKNCQFAFLNIENIHTMRESYQKLGKLLQRPCGTQFDATWNSAVEATGWLLHIREVLRGVLAMVTQVECNKGSILSHCSDGWDRTTQLCSLTELCLDPYYRTLQGFCVLIEKEWLSFGHKFQDRVGHADQEVHNEERSPIFQQWLECVFQLLHQFPHAFEFTPQLLLLISDHLYSLRFGTFLCNSQFERMEKKIATSTVSLWTYVLHNADVRNRCTNPCYHPSFFHWRALFPNVSVKKMVLWDDFWFRHVQHESYGGPGFFGMPAPPMDLMPNMSSAVMVHASAVREKLAELEAEMSRLKQENKQLQTSLKNASSAALNVAMDGGSVEQPVADQASPKEQ